MNKKDSKKKSNNGAGIISVIVFIVIVVRVFGIDELRRVFFMLRQGLADDGNLAGIIAVGAVSIVILFAALKAAVRAMTREKKTFTAETTRKTSAPLHSHDRLSGYTDGSCGDEEHWRKQLDGFLAAGIIDRSEYKILLEKRNVSYSRRT